jgi:hypothetical protein
VPRWVGIVAQVRLVGVGRDLVLRRGGPGGAQGAAADLLAELVERVAHISYLDPSSTEVA